MLEIPWEDIVTFYFGCSYSFDHFLVAAQVPIRHMIEKTNSPVYVSKIPLYPQGSFSGNMTVTMRQIPREFIQKVAEVCTPLDFAHGAPIHIGAPTLIGIEDFENPSSRDAPVVGEHDVPVFWGCGISATDAIASAKPDIAVSLSTECTGSLFITDYKVTDFYKDHPSQHAHLSPKVIFLSESPQFASLVSQETINEVVKKEKEFILCKLAEFAHGRKETGDYLLKSAMALSHASSVAIVTWSRKGIAVKVSDKQLAAVASIAKVLVAQEKEITVLTSQTNATDWQKLLVKCEADKILLKSTPVRSVTMTPSNWSRDVHLTLREAIYDLGPSFYSTSLNSVVLVNEQGNLYVQSLLCLGQDVNGVTTANQDHVIKNEQPIECDYWLSPSLVAMAAYVLNTCPIHSRYIRRGRGEHKVKAVDEFFITSKQMKSLGFEVLHADEWISTD